MRNPARILLGSLEGGGILRGFSGLKTFINQWSVSVTWWKHAVIMATAIVIDGGSFASHLHAALHAVSRAIRTRPQCSCDQRQETCIDLKRTASKERVEGENEAKEEEEEEEEDGDDDDEERRGKKLERKRERERERVKKKIETCLKEN